jgi:hypothetical protein
MFSLLPVSCLFFPSVLVFLRFNSFLPAFIPSLLYPFRLSSYSCFIYIILIELMNGKIAHEVTLLSFMRWVPGSILGRNMTVLIGVCGIFLSSSRRC